MTALDDMPAVELAEVLANASLHARVDRKYVLPLGDAREAVTRLAADEDVRVLEIAGLRRFAYESVYYDTPELLTYHLAAHGRPRRFKVRRRTYLDTGEAYTEVKSRRRCGTTLKERLAGATLDRDFVADALGRVGAPNVAPHRLAPTLTTRYRRTTLYLADSASRVTIDSDLSWALPSGAELALDGLVIVETKTAHGATRADRRLWTLGQRPRRISKYGTGLAALRADLPANKWHRLLDRHFHPLPKDTE